MPKCLQSWTWNVKSNKKVPAIVLYVIRNQHTLTHTTYNLQQHVPMLANHEYISNKKIPTWLTAIIAIINTMWKVRNLTGVVNKIEPEMNVI